MNDSQQLHQFLNKIQRDIPKFREITSKLDPLGISFTYAIVFNEKYYYILHDNFEFVTEFVNTVSRGCIFCGRDITGYCDNDYHFTLWPKKPTNQNMQIYFAHNLWYGLTISKFHDEYIEMWGFMTKTLEDKQEYLAKNKQLLLDFTHYFNCAKAELCIPKKFSSDNLFCLSEGFDSNIPSIGYTDKAAQKLMDDISTCGICVEINGKLVRITPTERLICCTLIKKFTVKHAAKTLGLSTRTIRTHINNLQYKMEAPSKPDILYVFIKNHLCF